MTITVCGNCIDFGSQSICVDPTGIYVSGRFDFAGCGLTPSPVQATETSSYYLGGACAPSPPAANSLDIVDKFPMASSTPSTDVGELAAGFETSAAHNIASKTTGFTVGGSSPSDPTRNPFSGLTRRANIVTFSNDNIATCTTFVNSFTPSGNYDGTDNGTGHSSLNDGYVVSGRNPRNSPAGAACFNCILKFPFANATGTTGLSGCLIADRQFASGHSSSESGYIAGGCCDPNSPSGGVTDSIEKFPFFAETPSTDVAELGAPFTTDETVGTSSPTDGYKIGDATIRKFPFATDSTAVAANPFPDGPNGDNRTATGGKYHGYVTGGYNFASPRRTDIFRFSHTSDTAVTCTGDLTGCRARGAGFAS